MAYRTYSQSESGIHFSVPKIWIESHSGTSGDTAAASALETIFKSPDQSAVLQFSVRRVTDTNEATYEQLQNHVSGNAFQHRLRYLRVTRLRLGGSNVPVVMTEFVSGSLFWKRRNWLITFVTQGIQPVLRFHASYNNFRTNVHAFLEAARSFRFQLERGFTLVETCPWFTAAAGRLEI